MLVCLRGSRFEPSTTTAGVPESGTTAVVVTTGLGVEVSSVQLKVQGFGLEGTLVVVSARPCGPTPTLVPE